MNILEGQARRRAVGDHVAAVLVGAVGEGVDDDEEGLTEVGVGGGVDAVDRVRGETPPALPCWTC